MMMMKSLAGIALGYSIFKLMEALAGYILWVWLDRLEKKLKKKLAKLKRKLEAEEKERNKP